MESESNDSSNVIRFPPEVQEVIDKVLIIICILFTFKINCTFTKLYMRINLKHFKCLCFKYILMHIKTRLYTMF